MNVRRRRVRVITLRPGQSVVIRQRGRIIIVRCRDHRR